MELLRTSVKFNVPYMLLALSRGLTRWLTYFYCRIYQKEPETHFRKTLVIEYQGMPLVFVKHFYHSPITQSGACSQAKLAKILCTN